MDIETIRTYDVFAKEYANETHDFWDRFPQDFLNKFTDNIGEGGRVLDDGSGPGRDGFKIQLAGLDVVCSDASGSMTKLSQALGLQTVQANFLDLPFQSSYFQGVWAYTSLLHIEKYLFPHALRETNRVMSPCAVLGLGMIEGSTEETRLTLNQYPRLFSYYSLNELNYYLKEAGFEPFYQETFKPKSRNYLNILAVKL